MAKQSNSTMNFDDLEREIVSLVKKEVTNFNDGTVFVTEKVAFQMRNLIRQLRKNYWGIFDKPFDPQTGKKKIWTHLTNYMVESVVKNIDTDTKDINIRAKRPSAISKTIVLRNRIREELDRMFFGETMDMLERDMSIDGTGVLKTWEEDGHVKTRNVDLLNFYIDPVARSIAESDSVIERHVMCMEDFNEQDFKNKEKFSGFLNVNVTDENYLNGNTYRGETKFVEVYERWGSFPKYFITGRKDDTQNTEGKIIVGKDGGTWHYLSCEENDGHKPYEECWYTRVANRWYGVGVAEKVMMEQLYINIVRNIRIVRHQISQLGIFKLRRGSGITPQMISKLTVNGVLPVNNMDDIEQMVVSGVDASSYNDESNAEGWAKKITSAFEAVTGETMPSSTTATTSAIQKSGAMSSFTLIKEGFGMFLQRWIKRHVLPIIVKNLKTGDIIRCSSSMEDYDEIIRNVAENFINDHFNNTPEENIPPLEEYNAMVEQKIEQLKKNGKDFFVELKEEIKKEDYDVEVSVTNEDMDKGVMVNNLIQMIPIAPDFRDQIVAQLFDLFGLPFNPNKKMPIPQEMNQQMQGVQSGQPNAQQLNTMSNTMAQNNIPASI